jgi:hypothetical protein
MNTPLRITIQTFGSRSHQSGKGIDARGSSGIRISYESTAPPPGPLVEHVRDGKPLTALGRKLLGAA